MSYCLNPDCLAVNAETHRFCQKCGQKLWLKDRYQALKMIGQGGFGKTFLAVDHDKPSKPRCVIKQFFPQGQGTEGLQKAAELFAEEAKRLDELGKHPQIPELLAYFIPEDQRQYLVQEYIEGENLEKELKSQGVFSQEKVRQVLLDLLPVLGFVHQQNVIHRDIKPENIIRRKRDNQLVLVDFGAAKTVIPSNRSVTGTVIGSAEYVAPEQLNGKAVNASDLYSLGVTCLYLLTGISPFDLFDVGEHEWCWRDYLVSNPVDSSLAQVLDKLVKFGTKKRYQEVSEVLNDLGVSSNPKVSAPNSKSVSQVSQKANRLNQTIISQNPSNSNYQPSVIPKALETYTEKVIVKKSFLSLEKTEIKIEMIKVPAGILTMGSNEYDNEKPIHQVTLNDFYLSRYPITQEQYQAIFSDDLNQAILGNNSLKFKSNPTSPAESVSWDKAKIFCQKLQELTGKAFRLPTEAEWEYACRAGTQSLYYFGDNENQLRDYAWYSDNSSNATHPVGQKKPNVWGFYDMIGNVWEWCEDTWHENYQGKPDSLKANGNMAWLSSSNSSYHVIRGGSWFSLPGACRSAFRSKFSYPDSLNLNSFPNIQLFGNNFSSHDESNLSYGFRLALSAF